jgi:putative phage-type endonuclease
MNPVVKELLERRQTQQLSPEWFSARNGMFTASSDVCGLISTGDTAYNKVIDKKRQPTKYKFKGNRHTFHGNKYEYIARQIYESRYSKQVLSLGLVTHANLPCLGASPDGVTTDGRLLEIKVPSVRKINGKISKPYFVQMQTQMECCNLDVCDFFECTITGYGCRDTYNDDAYDGESTAYLDDMLPVADDQTIVKLSNDRRTKHGLEKGMIGRIGYYRIGQDNKYKYPPMNLSAQEQYMWLKKLQKELSAVNVFMRIDYWKVERTSYTPVARDKIWWNKNDINNTVKAAWNNVVSSKNSE